MPKGYDWRLKAREGEMNHESKGRALAVLAWGVSWAAMVMVVAKLLAA